MDSCCACDQRFDPVYLEGKLRYTRDTTTQSRYLPDPPYLLRAKLLTIFFRNLLLPPLHLAYRVGHLLHGSFIERGKEIALHKFTLEMVETRALRGASLPWKTVCYYSIKEFSKDVIKIVLWVFCFPLLQIACLLGLACPFTARKFYATVERFYYIPPQDKFTPASSFDLVGGFTAPCMQPIEVWKEKNIFRYFTSDQPTYKDFYKTEENRFSQMLQKALLYFPNSPLDQARPILIRLAQKEASYSRQLLPFVQEAIRTLEEAILNFRHNRTFNPTQHLTAIIDQLRRAETSTAPQPLF